MFNYLFPIFCFGLVISGIVFLGILEAAKRLKDETSNALDRASGGIQSNPVSMRNGGPPRSAAPILHE